MDKKAKVVEFSIDRIANSTVNIDIESLREARNTDNRGYATWALKPQMVMTSVLILMSRIYWYKYLS